MSERLIKNTKEPVRCAWPEDCFIQGGSSGVVFSGKGNYVTAFVEAFPPETFLRGEGVTIEAAEADCYRQYTILTSCEHGPYEPRSYTNGSGYCVKCGTWFSGVCEIADDPEDEPSELVKALLGDSQAAHEVLAEMADILEKQGKK